MGTLAGIIIFFFIILCVFLVFLILIQSNKGGSSLGGLVGGASQTPWGASSADIMTKITRGSAMAFLVITLLLSFLFAKKDEKPPVLPENEVPNNSQPATIPVTPQVAPVTPNVQPANPVVQPPQSKPEEKK
jgi:preprotein translocase subunit SecG